MTNLAKQSKSTGLIGGTNVAGVPKYLGYAPGVWYDKGDMQPDNQRRFGNLITGAGLGLAGAASVPLLQWMFPDTFAKFKGQGKRLAIAAMAGGVAAPFLATLPAEIRGWRQPSKTSSYGQYGPGYPIMKPQLAGDILDEIHAGTLSPSRGMGFMENVGNYPQGDKPWLTARDLSRAAVGAGVGGGLGALVGRGIGYFVGLTPANKKLVRNAGLGLGALINTGKLGL